MDDFTPLNLFGDDETENASEIKEETLSAETEQEEKPRQLGTIKFQRECILNNALPLFCLIHITVPQLRSMLSNRKLHLFYECY